MTKPRWIEGNDIHLLENGEEFFPRVFACIANAKKEVVLETFILFEDKVGLQLHEALIAAARRGVQVDVTIDGFGSPDLSDHFISTLADAGVRMHVFDPGTRFFGQRLNLLRRMHRKIVVIDGETAFVGGINYSADHLADFGPEAKQDYSVEIHGPLVSEIHRFTHSALAQGQRYQRERSWWRWRRHMRTQSQDLPKVGTASAMFVVRDNVDHKSDIETHYRIAIRSARKRIVIANAYFFPGYRFIRELRRAARRGVDVRLILQGEPDMAIVKTAASMLYHRMISAGIKVYEYCERPLHGKVALVDDEWSTVGSSNLDPLSLSLNLEANVIIRDRSFNEHLHQRLQKIMRHACHEITIENTGEPTGWAMVRNFVAFHFTRRYPGWASWLPRHVPRLMPPRTDRLQPVYESTAKD
ncbi:MAG TPA: cardiolipin synthase ClsB [Ramlibacter sp.]|nr:cardiolipin synthase ClsB [Ramlibacter sp.]